MNTIKRIPNFITIEGVDGVGKSTVVGVIADYLESKTHKVTIVRQNRDTLIGANVRCFISTPEASRTSATTFALLMAASINDTIENIIEPAHMLGHIVISDRYTMSTRVYQKDSHYIDTICNIVEVQLSPDITFVLDATPDVINQRVTERNELTDVMESQGMCIDVLNHRRREFLRQARKHSNTYIIDASSDRKTVNEQIIKILSKYYK